MIGTCPDCGGDAFAGDVYCRQCGNPLPGGDQVKASDAALHRQDEANTELLASILDVFYGILVEQQRQTRTLGKINSVIQLWGLLLILGIIGACISMVLGFGWLSW